MKNSTGNNYNKINKDIIYIWLKKLSILLIRVPNMGLPVTCTIVTST